VDKAHIDGLILAGGQSARMKEFKPTVNFQEKPLIHHVLERLKPQVNRLYINTNLPIPNNKYPVIADSLENFQGPLSGLLSALSIIEAPWVQIAPCDTPFIPINLTSFLSKRVHGSDKKIITPITKQNIHPTLSLIHKSILEDLQSFLETEERGFINFINTIGYEEVLFDNEDCFSNINTPEDLIHYEKIKVNPVS